MKTATLAEASIGLRDLIDLVRGSETVEIVDGGAPVGRLVPAPASPDDEARLERLENAGVIRRGTGKRLTFDPLPALLVSSGVLDALLDERREGR